MRIDELKPENVFRFFSEISGIPHGSGNTEMIAEYCLNFAKERGLKAYRDDYGNVMIFKNGTKGYEQSGSVIIQGHIDMVCEKSPDCGKDMRCDGIDLVSDGKYLRADGTTLGADNGIAVAYILALLDDKGTIPHPPIEALLTTDEELGLRGARALDASKLTGKRMINIDSEAEGILTVGCAGGVRVTCDVPVSYGRTDGTMCAKSLSVRGLLGGHSGFEIGLGHKNASKVLAAFLYDLSKKTDLRIAGFTSDGKMNVIARTAEAVVCINKDNSEVFDRVLAEYNKSLKAACAHTEPEAAIVSSDAALPEKCLDKTCSDKVISTLLALPNGVSAISTDIPFLVETSSNLGIVSLTDDKLTLGTMIRSNTHYGKDETLRRLTALMESMGGTVTPSDDYPAWEYNPSSPLRSTMVEVYKEMYGNKPQICAVHAGLECGILTEKLDGADMISFGPNIQNAHTPSEQLDIESTERCWEFLLKVLERLK